MIHNKHMASKFIDRLKERLQERKKGRKERPTERCGHMPEHVL